MEWTIIRYHAGAYKPENGGSIPSLATNKNIMKIKTLIIPVIHMINQNQVLTNVKTCLSCGIEKVFIINHQTTSEELIKCAKKVKETYPNLWVGINILDKNVEDAILYDFDFNGLWCDQSIKLEDYKFRKFKGLLFTGLAFKYQPQPKDIESACKESILTSDVSTTSGPGTGKAADINKILELRKHLGNHPMAIASGVNTENIKLYKGIVDYLLVASSITSRSEIIDKEKLIELVELL